MHGFCNQAVICHILLYLLISACLHISVHLCILLVQKKSPNQWSTCKGFNHNSKATCLSRKIGNNKRPIQQLSKQISNKYVKKITRGGIDDIQDVRRIDLINLDIQKPEILNKYRKIWTNNMGIYEKNGYRIDEEVKKEDNRSISLYSKLCSSLLGDIQH